jgi:uncharacterized small protein (DUF1192 family)
MSKIKKAKDVVVVAGQPNKRTKREHRLFIKYLKVQGECGSLIDEVLRVRFLQGSYLVFRDMGSKSKMERAEQALDKRLLEVAAYLRGETHIKKQTRKKLTRIAGRLNTYLRHCKRKQEADVLAEQALAENNELWDRIKELKQEIARLNVQQGSAASTDMTAPLNEPRRIAAAQRTLGNEITRLKAALRVADAQYHLERARREHFYNILSFRARKDDRDYYTMRQALRSTWDFMDEIKEDVLWDAAVAE